MKLLNILSLQFNGIVIIANVVTGYPGDRLASWAAAAFVAAVIAEFLRLRLELGRP